jgi:hypothetical protein
MMPQPVISSSRATAGSTAASLAAAGLRPGGAVGVHPPGGGDLGDQLARAGGQLVDLPGQGVDLVQEHAGELGVVVLELPVQGLGEFLALGAHLADGQVREGLRVPLPGDQGLQHGPHRLGVQRGGDGRDLDQGALQQLLQPLPVPARSRARSARSRV